MILETLYKRTKTGAIQQYDIMTSIREGYGSSIIKHTGQLGGKLTRHIENIDAGKQGRSPEKQAEAQAQSDWKSKKDSGYKSLADLGYIQGVPGPANPEVEIACFLEGKLPQFNTDASGNLKPQKAPTNPWKPGKKLKWPQLIEPKMDGLRATLVVDCSEHAISAKFLSSGGHPYPAVTHLVDEFLEKYRGTESIIIDGELYCHGMTLEEINSAVKSLKPSTLDINFHIFDLPLLDDVQAARSYAAKHITAKLGSDKFPMLETLHIGHEDEVMIHHNRWVEQGYEGAMLKDPNGTYQPGQRSSFWTKVKMFDDTEFPVIDMSLGQREEDLIVTCRCKDGDFDVKMTGSRAIKAQQWADRANIIGKMQLTVKHFGFSKYGVPNLPVGKSFRDYE
jgi:ATP-dependent DNA ligase